MSFSNFLENELLDHVFAPAAYTAPATIYAKLHLGDPGEDGTLAPAVETTRKAVSFGVAAAGLISNDAQVQWTSLPAAETISHMSLWDAATAGNCLGAGALAAAKTVAIGDTLTVPVGDFDVTLD